MGIGFSHYFNVVGISHRGVSRIVAIDENGTFVGMYPVNALAESVEGNCIIFPLPKDHGNSICLVEGFLPKEAWIDGELPYLFK